MSSPLSIGSTVKLLSGISRTDLRLEPKIEGHFGVIGHSMPILGLGVYQNRGDTVVSACLAAFKAGYRCVVQRLSGSVDY